MRENLLMVGNEREHKAAMDAGWPPMEIVRPNLNHMQGRRYKRLYITWGAIWIMQTDPHLEALQIVHTQSVYNNAKVEIVTVPPDLNKRDEEIYLDALKAIHPETFKEVSGGGRAIPAPEEGGEGA